MSHRTWMAFYTADFLAKTMHLCPKQAGAYVFLICHYWNHDGLPSNASQLARIARLTPEEWAEHEPILKSFFHDGWKHERIDEELAIAEEKHRKRVESGTHGGKQKASNARVLLEQKPSNALPTTTTTTTTKKEVSKSSSRRQTPLPSDWALSEDDRKYARERGIREERVEQLSLDFKNHHLAKGNVMADWHRAWCKWVGNEIKWNGVGNGQIQNRGNILPAAERLRDKLAQLNRPTRATEESSQSGICGGTGGNIIRLIPEGGGE